MRKGLSIVLLVLLIMNSMAVGFAGSQAVSIDDLTKPFTSGDMNKLKDNNNSIGALIYFNGDGMTGNNGVNYGFSVLVPKEKTDLIIELSGITDNSDAYLEIEGSLGTKSLAEYLATKSIVQMPSGTAKYTKYIIQKDEFDEVTDFEFSVKWDDKNNQEVAHVKMWVAFEPNVTLNNLTIEKEGQGMTSPAAGSTYQYASGASVELQATEADGWRFVNWTKGDEILSDSPNTSVVVNEDMTVTAHFTEEYDLTVTAGEGGDASAVEENPHVYGDRVSLTATPDYGWEFSHWEGDVEQISDVNNPDTTIQMMGNQSAHAVFERELFTLNTSVNNSTGGSVTPLGSNPYDYETSVDLKAVPTDGWYFTGWTGTDAADIVINSATTGSILMDADKTVVANFAEVPKDQYKLTVSVIGHGSGTTIPGVGDHYYTEGSDPVALIANAAIGSHFVEWTINGDPVLSSSASVIMNQNNTGVARFELDTHYLTVSQIGSGTTSPLGEEMPYSYGSEVTLTADPAEGWSFAGWFDDGEEEPFSQSLNETITITADRIIEARYTEDPVDLYYSLTIEVIGEGTGITNPDEGPHSYLIANGESETVTVSANAADGSTFAGWFGPNGNEVTDNKIVLDENKTIIARFDLDPVTPPVDPVSMNFFADVSGIFSEDEANFMIQRDESQEDLTFKLLYSGPVPVATVTFSTAQENLNPILESDGSWTVNGFLPGELITMNVSNVNADFVYDYLEVNESADESLSYSFTVPEANFSSMAAFYEEEGTTPGGGGGFTPITYALKVKVVGNGTVNPSVGVHRYSPGTVVDLAPSAMNGWEFFGWDGAVQADQIVMNGDRMVTAIFKEIERVPLAPPTVTPPPIIILDEEVPKDDGALPDTGVDASMSNLLLGAGSILLGILNRKKK